MLIHSYGNIHYYYKADYTTHVITEQQQRFLVLALSQNVHFKQNLVHTQPPIKCVMAALPPGIKLAERENGHSPTSSAENKNAWSCTYTPPYVIIAWRLINSVVLS